jgi:hypothetical protein
MENPGGFYLFDSDVRFLEYRLDVVGQWPASPLKEATAEAISRRLAAIGRATLGRPDVHGLLSASCRLLDHIFSDSLDQPPAVRQAA